MVTRRKTVENPDNTVTTLYYRTINGETGFKRSYSERQMVELERPF